MSLKKTIPLVMLAAALTVHGQDETFNIFLGMGPGFGMGGKLYSSSERTGIAATPTNIEDKFFNYGGGIKFDAGCQYFIMENVALQPAFSFSAGPSFKTTNTIGTTTDSYTQSRFIFGLKLAIVPRFEILDLLDVYTGVGLGFFWNASRFKRVYDVPSLTVVQNAEGSIVSQPTVGFNGTLGADFPLNDRFTLFGELGFEQMRFKLKRMIVEKSTITGFEEGTLYYSKNDPQNLDPEEIPSANFQIRVGIRYVLF
jgi:opacity protein-like surface antigen